MTLTPPKYTLFSPAAIRPTGWMRRQLEIQAAGLSGNLDKIWPDVRDSRWIGGDREAWERVPYWLDGFIPLAYLLDNDDLKTRARRYIDAILDRQCDDGWICPCGEGERANYDTWALLLISKVLVLYYDCSGDERIPGALYRAMQHFNLFLDKHTLRNWGASRWFEGLFAVWFLYDRCHEDWLLELADKLAVEGFDWKTVFARWHYAAPQKKWSQLSHVVNQAMMLKQEALYARVSGDSPSAFARQAFAVLMEAHGAPYGLFTGDECLSGRSPIQGTELCAVVEAMFSFETLLEISGDAEWGDRLEYLAFNALPSTFTPDMWAHQYDQMANQIECTILPAGGVHYSTNGREANLFGLEPNYGCCTANLSQGYPKLMRSAFMRRDGGLAVAVLLPGELETEMDGVPVKLRVETEYPFRDRVRIIVKTDAPVSFDMDLRIPGFADTAELDGEALPVGAFHTVSRTWTGTTALTLSLGFTPRWQKGCSDMFSLRRGPLLFALPLRERAVMREYVRQEVERKFPYCDYELLPLSRWNLAFAGEPGAVSELPYDAPFTSDAPPLAIEVPMCPIDWPCEIGRCAPLPQSRIPLAPPEPVRLIPYGCTNLRMTVIPKIEDN